MGRVVACVRRCAPRGCARQRRQRISMTVALLTLDQSWSASRPACSRSCSVCMAPSFVSNELQRTRRLRRPPARRTRASWAARIGSPWLALRSASAHTISPPSDRPFHAPVRPPPSRPPPAPPPHHVLLPLIQAGAQGDAVDRARGRPGKVARAAAARLAGPDRQGGELRRRLSSSRHDARRADSQC